MGDTTVWTILLELQPNCTINSKAHKDFLLFYIFLLLHLMSDDDHNVIDGFVILL